jgi:hypothetical protein
MRSPSRGARKPLASVLAPASGHARPAWRSPGSRPWSLAQSLAGFSSAPGLGSSPQRNSPRLRPACLSRIGIAHGALAPPLYVPRPGNPDSPAPGLTPRKPRPQSPAEPRRRTARASSASNGAYWRQPSRPVRYHDSSAYARWLKAGLGSPSNHRSWRAFPRHEPPVLPDV